MSEAAMQLPLWAALLVSVLLVVGGAICVIGALGLMRLPTFYQRVHGPAITVSLGAGCLLVASMLFFSAGQQRLVLHEVVITLFVLLTAPVVSMMVMRAAVYRDLQTGRRDSGAAAGDVYPFSQDAGPPAP
ncbi:cation:proton antiporter [Ramlibacter sp. AW1]|uniref:Cation:proton antiporter n=1 Tax=Ramlibacter aurantiacus TaxID=2801330 RepID=A0A936ZFQ8_9BURK|nr:monovalent cation/H(+) antiporter subunit G [Ramlibacter aurantiacus]MBL0420669.1 cation:proton antiporter [Ramlibacter aurantiacus]